MDTRDQRLAIIEIQRNLRELSKGGWEITSLTADGIYGPRTREAVRQFQTIEALPVTGVVDALTWQVLDTAATVQRGERAPARSIDPWNRTLRGGVIEPGEQTDLVYLVQLMLRESIAYDQNLPLTGILDTATQNALADFQEINGLPPSGIIDRNTWNALADAYNKYLPQTANQ